MKLSAGMLIAILFISGCNAQEVELKTVPYVDISQFMGAWYVIANIPTFLEKEAHNAIESYQLDEKGRIATTFSFRKGSVEGPLKEYHPRGFIYNHETKAEWRMQFLWPFKLPYLVIGLAEDYSWTVIGVPNRKYVWIMARQPELPAAVYDSIIHRLQNQGYEIEKIQKVPQDWS